MKRKIRIKVPVERRRWFGNRKTVIETKTV